MVTKLLNNQNTNLLTGNGSLSQSTPNSASGTTRIAYTLPAGSSRAQLVVTDALGKIVRTLQREASGTVQLNTAALSSGIYNYSLIVDGKTADTKRLTITR